MNQELFSMAEVVRLLSITPWHLYRLEYADKLPTAKRIGRTRYYTQEDVNLIREVIARDHKKGDNDS